MKTTVFYSWQADLDNRTNRGFIERALEKAVRDLRKDGSLEVEPVVDRDVSGEAGAIDIGRTILEKIERAGVFVADVSIVGTYQTAKADTKHTPNPNVLLELGWALHVLGEDRVVLVMNTAVGDVRDLPFDLNKKNVLTYSRGRESSAGEGSELEGKLRRDLETILKRLDAARREELPREPRLVVKPNTTRSTILFESPHHSTASDFAVLSCRLDIENDSPVPAKGVWLGLVSWTWSARSGGLDRSDAIQPLTDAIRRKVEIRNLELQGPVLFHWITVGRARADLGPFGGSSFWLGNIRVPRFRSTMPMPGAPVPTDASVLMAAVYVSFEGGTPEWYQLSVPVPAAPVHIPEAQSERPLAFRIDPTSAPPVVAWERGTP